MDEKAAKALMAKLLRDPNISEKISAAVGGPVPSASAPAVAAPPPFTGFSSSAAGGPPATAPSPGMPLTAELFDAFHALMWDAGLDEADVRRWYSQGFVFSSDAGCEMGLRQRNGGPCGVLAPVQARVLKHLFFAKDAALSLPSPSALATPVPTPASGSSGDLLPTVGGPVLTPPTVIERRTALVHALAAIILQAGNRGPSAPPCAIVVKYTPVDGNPATVTSPATHYTLHSFTELPAVVSFVSTNLPQFETPAGVILLVMSVVLSRGIDQVKRDMEDTETRLVARFGHCSQELLNLCLCGIATPHVFDGVKSEDGLELRGITDRPDVGYLTQLEALRYTEVGDNYKSPVYPVWVVGSQMHFTVLFSLDPKSNEPSLSSVALREFNRVDVSRAGFINTSDLRAIVTALGLPVLATEAQFQAFSSKVDNGGLVLWPQLWTEIRQYYSDPSPVPAAPAAPSPAVIASSTSPASSAWSELTVKAVFSKYDSGGGFIPTESLRAVLNDLGVQAGKAGFDVQFGQIRNAMDAEGMGIILWDTFFSNVIPYLPTSRLDSSPADDMEVARRLQEAEYGSSGAGAARSAPSPVRRFTLYHYNGLEDPGRRPACVPIVVSQPDDSADLMDSITATTDADIAVLSVIRTKWPGSSLDFLGRPPPKLD